MPSAVSTRSARAGLVVTYLVGEAVGLADDDGVRVTADFGVLAAEHPPRQSNRTAPAVTALARFPMTSSSQQDAQSGVTPR